MTRDVTRDGPRCDPRLPEMAGDGGRLPEVPSSRGVGVAEYDSSAAGSTRQLLLLRRGARGAASELEGSSDSPPLHFSSAGVQGAGHRPLPLHARGAAHEGLDEGNS